MAHYFTNEKEINKSGSYGVLSDKMRPEKIEDNITERGASLCKLGSSMPSPVARLFLFSSAIREINAIEGENPHVGHEGKFDHDGNVVQTPYHDLVGELLDMLEFVFKYGDEPDFHVIKWDPVVECDNLNKSPQKAHHALAAALDSAFSFGQLNGQPIYLFLWDDSVIGGTSPISLVYTSANLRTVMVEEGLKFVGNEGNRLFVDEAIPLHKRSKEFREYLYRLRLTDLAGVQQGTPLYELSKYIEDSANVYDATISKEVNKNPSAFNNVKNLTTQGNNVKVGGAQLRVSDHTVIINSNTSDYILKPTSDIYKHSNAQTQVPLVLINQGCDGLVYAMGRQWIPGKDVIDNVLSSNLAERKLPGFGQTKYPYLTIGDLLEDRIVEVSYDINSERFFTGSQNPITYLLPLKPLFFEYFKVSDLVKADGSSTGMLTMDYDSDRERVIVQLNLPLVKKDDEKGHNTICLYKTYNTAEGSEEKVDCYDGAATFDMALFPYYRLVRYVDNEGVQVEIASNNNVYNLMVGSTIDNIELNFYEPKDNVEMIKVQADTKKRSIKGSNGSQLSTNHIFVGGSFSYAELSATVKGDVVNAMIIPIFNKINSDPATAANKMAFSIDFGTTNTHVSYACVRQGDIAGKDDVNPFAYDISDSQMAMLNSRNGAAEFGAFSTAVKREFIPATLGDNVKFPMRTATYQIAGKPVRLAMFENTNIGFNYGADLAKSRDYHTNIKWDRFDSLAEQRMATYFEQMLWMMKNKSVQNGCSDSFDVVVTYPISMRQKDLIDFQGAWNNAKSRVLCNANIRYRTESVAPYYSYLGDLYGEAYVNIDIGGGTTDMLYYNPLTTEANVFSAFFAANDLWGDGADKAMRSSKANGFVSYYKNVIAPNLGDDRTTIEDVCRNANSSADIISYLFANDDSTQLTRALRHSPIMLQLPVIHFSALAFYIAYSLYVAEVDAPKHISFTGMGSKYIKLISSAESDIARIINATFHYVGLKLNSETLRQASVNVTFAPEPKKVTSEGALISLGYNKPINPSEDTYYGFMDEDPGKTLRYQDITTSIEDGVLKVYRMFLEMFNSEWIIPSNNGLKGNEEKIPSEMSDVLGDLGCNVEQSVINRLSELALASMKLMKDITLDGQNLMNKLKEPMFFWPLKNSLYVVGKEIVQNAINQHNQGQ